MNTDTTSEHTSVIYGTALTFLEAHIGVLPVTAGSKGPHVQRWKQYQEHLPTPDDLYAWFGTGPDCFPHTGLGVVTGQVSGGLEVLDFDAHDVYDTFCERCRFSGLGSLLDRIQEGYEEYTPNGVHLYYRVHPFVPAAHGNTKLAQQWISQTQIKAIIETRGEGGFCIAAPSYQVHESGKPYVLTRGNPLLITDISVEDRNDLFDIARSLHEGPVQEAAHQERTTTQQETDRPGDVFCRTATWEDVLFPHGWQPIFTHQGVTYWRRPGKENGISATTNYHNTDFLYVFSTSTVFEAERGYNKFSAYALLNFNGNFEQAAEALILDTIRQRNADQPPPPEPPLSPPPHESPTPPEPPFLGDYNLTDLGNAERFAVHHAGKALYCAPWKKWLLWDTIRWQPDSRHGIALLARETIRLLYSQAADIEGATERKALIKHALKSEQESRINAMLSLAHALQPIHPTQLDTNAWYLATLNGVLDLNNQEFYTSPQPHFYITKTVQTKYDPTATCPRWEQFLQEIFDEDQDTIAFVQKAAGYSLTGSTSEQCLFLLYGTGANGKSTFIDTLRNFLGDYAETAEFSTFLKKDREVVRNDLARLHGARWVSAIEMAEGKCLDETVVKSVTGGDEITARFLFGEYFSFTPQFKLWMAVNHKPAIKASDAAFWRRIHLVPFTRTFTPEERDKGLRLQLQEEYPGILRWAIEGCQLWQKEGLVPSEQIQEATASYHDEMDTIGGFLIEKCEMREDFRVGASDLYLAYTTWCQQEGLQAEGMTVFGRSMTTRGFIIVRDSLSRRKCRTGIRLTEQS